MFDTKVLERLSRVHWSVPLIIFVPPIIVLLALGFADGAGVASILYILGGVLFWTLTEYWLHRAVFHFDTGRGFITRLHWIMHGVHHDHPNDPMRLVMPPAVSIPLAVIFLTVFALVLGSPYWMIFGAAFLSGYLLYDMTHYYVHHGRPRTVVGRKLREWHMRHHFQDHERGFGVSSPTWDHVFGTKPRHVKH